MFGVLVETSIRMFFLSDMFSFQVVLFEQLHGKRLALPRIVFVRYRDVRIARI